MNLYLLLTLIITKPETFAKVEKSNFKIISVIGLSIIISGIIWLQQQENVFLNSYLALLRERYNLKGLCMKEKRKKREDFYLYV